MTASWLWLYGPAGVGKSATGFALFEHLAESGELVAFVEIDQIGMCMPRPVLARSAAKADNLLGILDNFTAAGAHGVIVSGDIVETMRDVLGRTRKKPVLCRLRATDDITLERLIIRRSVHFAMASADYESHGVPAGDLEVATHPGRVEEVAAEILRRLGPWPPAPNVAHLPPRPAQPAIDASAILVTGPRTVGTSTVAWQVLMDSITSGHCTGYLDLDQLGFLPTGLEDAAPPTTLANVATCWAGFRAQGAERLVLCGHLGGKQLDPIRKLTPSLRVAALTATPDTLIERARRRRRQKDLWLPGDDLFGRDEAYLHEVVGQAATFDSEPADLVVAPTVKSRPTSRRASCRSGPTPWPERSTIPLGRARGTRRRRSDGLRQTRTWNREADDGSGDRPDLRREVHVHCGHAER